MAPKTRAAKQTHSKLISLGKRLVNDIGRGKNPYLDIPIRALSNVAFDEKKGIKPIPLEEITAHGAGYLLKTAIAIERLSRGVATERSEETIQSEVNMNIQGKVLHGHVDLSKLTEEQLRQMEKLLELASGNNGDTVGT